MKQLKLYVLGAFCMMASFAVTAQSKTSTFEVAGNCGMCKSKIEKAAKDAGATFANWNVEDKKITVKYDTTSTSDKKIQNAIAKSGYDNAGIKADTKTYNDLSKCCQYDRTAAAAKAGKDVKGKKGKKGGCCGSTGSGCSKPCCAGKGE